MMIEWGLPPGDVEYVLQGAISLRELRPRETLFKQGAPVTHIYLLREGTVFQDRMSGSGKDARVSLRREVPAGQFVGQYDLLYGQQHSTRARALDACRLVAIEANALNRLLYAYPDIRESLAPLTLIGRLRTIPFFERIDTTSLCLLAEMCEQWEFDNDETIYDIYDSAERLFIIDEGQVCLESPLGETRWLGNGMEFGFLEQTHDDPSIVARLSYGHRAMAVGTAQVFAWPREIILELAGIHPERTAAALQASRKQAIHAISVFADFTEEQREKLLGYMSHYYFPCEPHCHATGRGRRQPVGVAFKQPGNVACTGRHASAAADYRIRAEFLQRTGVAHTASHGLHRAG